MKKFLALVGVLAFAIPASAQVTLPQVSSITPGTDLIQIIPGGQPAQQNVYAPVAMVRGGSSANGIFAAPLRLLDFKNVTGATIATSAGAGVFGYSITAGTSEKLTSEAANSNTKTDVAAFELILPSGYVAGSNITVTTNSNYTLGSGTVGIHTIAAAAYLTAADGTQGSTLIATAAQSVPATAGSQTFVITGATLTPGSRLFLTFTLVIQDTGGSNITATLNSVSIS